MKSKRYTTEQKIRILRDAERADISIVDGEPRPQVPDRRYLCEPGLMQGTCSLPSFWPAPQHLPIRSETTQCLVGSFEDSS